jgi:hypothetical protein
VSTEVLTDEEIRDVRALVHGFSRDELKALKAFAVGVVSATGGKPPATATTPATQDDLHDHFLDSQPWADRTIRKDPKRWAGEPMAGRKYSEAPPEWHTVNAEFLDWAVNKAKLDPNPKLQERGKNAGKPWYEADEFEAKICRAWARRNSGKPAPAPRAAESEDGWVPGMPLDSSTMQASPPVDTDDLPF